MRVLIVGAGAVGQVYGRHLQLGGAEVSFLVRPKYADQVRRGLTLYPLNGSDRWTPRRLDGCGVLTDPARPGDPDHILLSVSSTALRQGDWLAKLGAAARGSTVVTLQPGIEDRAVIIDQLGMTADEPADRLVTGLISFMSYVAQDGGGAPLPAPGVAYWIPPFTRLTFSGPDAHVGRVVKRLRQGGLPASRHADVRAQTAFAGPLLQMQIIALECAGWRFAELRRQRALRRLAFDATREAIRIAGARLGRRPPALIRALRPWMISAALWVTRRIAPFDVERFFELHFTKVGDQTRHQLDTWLRLGRQQGVEAPAIAALADRLPPAPTATG